MGIRVNVCGKGGGWLHDERGHISIIRDQDMLNRLFKKFL